jgi:hypothetical protein
MQLLTRFDVQLATHWVVKDWVLQLGSSPPLTTSVPQQSGVAPPQSSGLRHRSVSLALHDPAHAGAPEPCCAQHT